MKMNNGFFVLSDRYTRLSVRAGEHCDECHPPAVERGALEVGSPTSPPRHPSIRTRRGLNEVHYPGVMHRGGGGDGTIELKK